MRRTLLLTGLMIAVSLSASAIAQERSFPEAHYGTNSEPVYDSQAAPASREPAPSAASAESEEQSKPAPQIIVYGRTSCGWTMKAINDLKQVGIPYIFKNIEDPATLREMVQQTTAAGYGGKTGVPVIVDDGQITIGYDGRYAKKSK